MEKSKQSPFVEETVQNVEIVPMNRVEAMAALARQSFQNCIVEYGGEEKMKEMKRKANAALKIPLDDVSALETVKKAKQLYVKARTSLDKTKDLIKRDIIDAGKAIEIIRTEFGEPFTTMEVKLTDRQKEIEDLITAKEEEEAKAKEELKRSRIAKVEESGAKFNGQWWAINDISVGAQMMEEAPEDLFVDLLSKIKVQFDLNETARIEKENKEREEREALEAEKERQRIEKENMDKEREEMETMKREIEAEKEKMRKEKEEEAVAKAEREREAEAARLKAELETKMVPFIEMGYSLNQSMGRLEYAKGEYMASIYLDKIDDNTTESAKAGMDNVDTSFSLWQDNERKKLEDAKKEEVFQTRVRQLTEMGFEKNDNEYINAYTNKKIYFDV